MADSIQIEIVTPERKVIEDTATEITVPGKGGYLGILPGHAPLISELAVGAIDYRTPSGQQHHLSCAWGFVEVLPEKVTILAEVSERGEEIDVERARRARERAAAALKSGDQKEEERDRAQRDLQMANARLEVAGKIDPALANILP